MIKTDFSDEVLRQTVESWLDLENLADRDVTVTDRTPSGRPEGPTVVISVKASAPARRNDTVILPYPPDLRLLSEAVRSFDCRQTAHQTGDDAVIICIADRSVEYGNRKTSLTSKEFALLLYMAENSGKVLSRSEINSVVWADDSSPDTNNIDVYVSYLRKKIDSVLGPGSVVSVRGQGYLFTTGKTITVI